MVEWIIRFHQEKLLKPNLDNREHIYGMYGALPDNLPYLSSELPGMTRSTFGFLDYINDFNFDTI